VVRIGFRQSDRRCVKTASRLWRVVGGSSRHLRSQEQAMFVPSLQILITANLCKLVILKLTTHHSRMQPLCVTARFRLGLDRRVLDVELLGEHCRDRLAGRFCVATGGEGDVRGEADVATGY
jgi:hypothetical protein